VQISLKKQLIKILAKFAANLKKHPNPAQDIEMGKNTEFFPNMVKKKLLARAVSLPARKSCLR